MLAVSLTPEAAPHKAVPLRQERGGRLVVPRAGKYTLTVGIAGRPQQRAVAVSRVALAVGEAWKTSSLLAGPDRGVGSCAGLPVDVQPGSGVSGAGVAVVYVDLCEVPQRCMELHLPLKLEVGEPAAAGGEDGEICKEMRGWLTGQGFEQGESVLFAACLPRFDVAVLEQVQDSDTMLELD